MTGILISLPFLTGAFLSAGAAFVAEAGAFAGDAVFATGVFVTAGAFATGAAFSLVLAGAGLAGAAFLTAAAFLAGAAGFLAMGLTGLGAGFVAFAPVVLEEDGFTGGVFLAGSFPATFFTEPAATFFATGFLDADGLADFFAALTGALVAGFLAGMAREVGWGSR